jgi:7-cyano-7-deazaguanine synthase
MEKVVLILSGGIDSTTLLYDLVKQYGKENVHALSFNYNQRHLRELGCAKKSVRLLGVTHKILNLKVLGGIAPSALTRDDIEVPDGHYESENMKITVVPNRNMVMLSLATSYAIGIGVKKLFYGAHSGDHFIYNDCRPEFVEAMKVAINLCDDSKVELLAPYSNKDKGDIVIWGKELGVNYKYTRTCYKSGKKSCGLCSSCTERLEAFKKAGIKDPIKYEDGQKE